jgi:carbonic anhydrase
MKSFSTIKTALLISFVIGVISCTSSAKKDTAEKTTMYDRTPDALLPDIALQILKEGNDRFVKNTALTDNISAEKRKQLKEKGQKPFAVILTCSDSRVPPEIIFDQGLGDLFVVRVAGNVVDSVVMGSIEYAAEHLHSSLIVALGHEKCGAVTASVEGGEVPGSIPAICQRIKPAVTQVRKTVSDKEQLIGKVIEENVEENIALLQNNKLLKELLESGKLKITGGVYHLESGEVTFK